ncbi:hypothetical protein [Bradyrhizobium japonicum]|uniref:hypothetical protein n=1 Tax=Bradyrhizobium japonicum TaxID=375 RepID=UPI0027149D86|nr:hypothetical protein [Bradyrhizobium japonicum]WLB51091.1 hypothetical protein QIH94_27450 [Bradyrhizobium japonicum]WLB67135.1 hypothetical protein QIH96_18875 [Bradyrhizobium japonicum]
MRATAAVPLDGGAETASTAASAISGLRFKARPATPITSGQATMTTAGKSTESDGRRSVATTA